MFTSPAGCADLVSSGKADLGLVPVIELARAPGLVAVPGLCIASESEVRSVLVLSRVPLEEIRSVLLDPASRTSVALCRILLGERLPSGVYEQVRFDSLERSGARERNVSVSDLLSDHDAAVVIGDPALMLLADASRQRNVYRYDLASEWRTTFGEPFVFATWAGRRDRLEAFDPHAVRSRLEESFAYGTTHLDEIVHEAAEELELSTSALTEYFRSSLHYSLGEAELGAVDRFHRLARKYGLADSGDEEIEWFE